MKVHTRIFIGFLVVLAVGFTAFLYWIVGDLKPQFRKATEEPLVDASRVLASLAAVSVKDGRVDAELFGRTIDNARSQEFMADIYGFTKTGVDYRVYITDASGIVVFDSRGGRDEGKDYSHWNDVYLTLNGRYGARSTQEDPADPASHLMYVASPIMVDGNIAGVLSVGKPTANINLFAEDAKRKIVMGGLITGLSAVLVGMLLSWRITAPIKRLTAYARQVRDGGRAELPELGGGETRELGEAFDEMRGALEGKQYVENYIQTLTHEIKSPVSAIRGATELLSEEDVPPEQRARFLANIWDESERIEQVVEKLLLLARLEKISHLEDLEWVDMVDVVTGVRESMLPLLRAGGLALDAASEGECSVEADPFLIRQAVANLVKNAIDFSPRGGRITVEARRAGQNVEVVVRDQGSGIPDYAAGRIFERFYSLKRPDTGRKSSGLGLCLVREVALLHNGSIELANSPLGGVTATLSIPRKPF